MQFKLTTESNDYFFVQINRMRENGTDACYRTEVKRNDYSVLFNKIDIHIQTLCNGDVVFIFYFSIVH